MTVCPDCGHKNIEGADTCESCGQSLTPLSRPSIDSQLGKSIVKDRIASLEPAEPVTVAPVARVGDVLDLMYERQFGCVLVVDNEELVGIFSERDALVRLNTDAAALADEPVSKYMTESPGTLEMHDRIAFAIHKMALGGYRHIPIMNGGKPTGVISIRDILRYATEKLQSTQAAASK